MSPFDATTRRAYSVVTKSSDQPGNRSRFSKSIYEVRAGTSVEVCLGETKPKRLCRDVTE
jgi:hypothetical protein